MAEATSLSTLIAHVKKEEDQLHGAKKETLLSLAKSVLCGYGSIQECREAVAVLARYHLAKLANVHPRFRKESWRLIAVEEAKAYTCHCVNCGRPINSRKSLATGLGIVCRKKLGSEAKG